MNISAGSVNIKSLLSKGLVQKYLTGLMITFLGDAGLMRTLEDAGQFSIEGAVDLLRKECGYELKDPTRARMIKTVIDFLCECGYVEQRDPAYVWNRNNEHAETLSDDECALVRDVFSGQVNFFENCFRHALVFLKGSPPLYGFNNKSIGIWKEFLGNEEYGFARSVLIDLLSLNKPERLSLLDLCYGPGFNIIRMQQQHDNLTITALDFKDIFRQQACSAIPHPDSVTFVGPGLWKGFGGPLPFKDGVFDVVLFTCADPYIPEHIREYVYGDIRRVLKRGGALGIMTHSYPDAEREYVGDKWIRRGVLCHDFAESVCEGWRGFYGAKDSADMFRRTGFRIEAMMLNASIWVLRKSR